MRRKQIAISDAEIDHRIVVRYKNFPVEMCLTVQAL